MVSGKRSCSNWRPSRHSIKHMRTQKSPQCLRWESLTLSPSLIYAVEQHRFHPEPKFCAPDGQPCGPGTCCLLQRRHVQIGRKIPIRKESNRRWQEGEDLSVLQAYEQELESTATEYVRAKGKLRHSSHAVASPQVRDWLQAVSLSLISQITGIKREHLRAIRDGKRGRRKTLARLADLKQRWTKGQQSGSLQRAIMALRSGGWRDDSEVY